MRGGAPAVRAGQRRHDRRISCSDRRYSAGCVAASGASARTSARRLARDLRVVRRDGERPAALFWVQIAHALQYLAFPVRVELNRTRAADAGSPRRIALHMAVYAGVLLAVSFAVAQLVPVSTMGVVGNVFGEQPGRAAPILLLVFINIHHYFTDGVIWKISNPDVRRDLFAHVAAKRPRATVPSHHRAWEGFDRGRPEQKPGTSCQRLIAPTNRSENARLERSPGSSIAE